MPKAKRPPTPKFRDSAALLEYLFDRCAFFHPDDDGTPPIPYVWDRGQGQTNLVVIVGENATGKSMLRRLVCQGAREAGYEPMAVSMQGRTTEDWSRAFVYGAEDWESTGQISARTVLGGISTCQGREKDHVIFWDEPDLGLSDSWAAGVGLALANFSKNMPAKTKGAFVVTHSKPLLRQIALAGPHYVALGPDAPKTLAEWLACEPQPRDITELGERSHALFKRLTKILKG